MVMEILGRRIKPNVIIVGEPGVGKTALVDGLALSIIENKVPDNLKGAVLFELDLGALFAGASYKGEVEERLKGIIKEIKQFDKAILFIDEIHSLLDPKGNGGGAANLLKPELARGEITVIGATTLDEYRQYIEKDAALERRFQTVLVDEPSVEDAITILRGLKEKYEVHHGVRITDGAIVSEMAPSASVPSVMASSVAVSAPIPLAVTSKVEEIVPIVSKVMPIPSAIATATEVVPVNQSVSATTEAPKMKYKITVMPEALCDGCQ